MGKKYPKDVDRNLFQTNIIDCVRNWQVSSKQQVERKRMLKMTKDVIVVVDDENGNAYLNLHTNKEIDVTPLIPKRRIPFPLDDDDDFDVKPLNTILNSTYNSPVRKQFVPTKTSTSHNPVTSVTPPKPTVKISVNRPALLTPHANTAAEQTTPKVAPVTPVRSTNIGLRGVGKGTAGLTSHPTTPTTQNSTTGTAVRILQNVDVTPSKPPVTPSTSSAPSADTSSFATPKRRYNKRKQILGDPSDQGHHMKLKIAVEPSCVAAICQRSNGFIGTASSCKPGTQLEGVSKKIKRGVAKNTNNNDGPKGKAVKEDPLPPKKMRNDAPPPRTTASSALSGKRQREDEQTQPSTSAASQISESVVENREATGRSPSKQKRIESFQDTTPDMNPKLNVIVLKYLPSWHAAAEHSATASTSVETSSGAERRNSSSGSPSKRSTNTTGTLPRTPTKSRIKRYASSPKGKLKKSTDTTSGTRNVRLIKEKIFDAVKGSIHANNIIKKEIDVMEGFFQMDIKYQYVCLKLLTRQWKWYNIHKFCESVNADMDDNEVAELYEYFRQNGYVDTDYTKTEDVLHLLKLLVRSDLRSICNDFKLNSQVQTKSAMIDMLNKYCNTQCTLTSSKTSKDLLVEKIKDKMGYSVRVKREIQQAFDRVYVMATFTNSTFALVKDFFFNMLQETIVFPQYDVEDYVVFYTSNEFISYAEASKRFLDLDRFFAERKHVEILANCREIFDKLKTTPHSDDTERYKQAPHLRKYSARSVYVSCLSKGIEYIQAKFPQEVKLWLRYLIDNFTSRRLGDWYSLLCSIYIKNDKKYNDAAHLLIEAFTKHGDRLSEVQRLLLGLKAERLKSSKLYKIEQLHHDNLAKYVPVVPEDDFHEIQIDASAVRGSESGYKRHYLVQEVTGSTYLTVEDIALRHYTERLGYTNGRHCEGNIIKCLFTLLFWDIIYYPERHVPAAFISKLQTVPLDMYTAHFYKNRQEEIDRRLEDIRTTWSDRALLSFARSKYDQHSHETSLCQVQSNIGDVVLLETLIRCIGRKVLADIFKRFVSDIRQYGSGMPDLLLWNTETRKAKFVEVKGEGDKLSAGQKLWIRYLMSIGANVEVCHVHSIGSKRKKLKGNVKKDTGATAAKA